MAYTGININDLHRYIEKIALQVVDLNGSNTVVMGTIEESLAGYYNVKLTNSDTTSMVKAITLGNGSYKVDDYVYLIKAENEGGGTETRYFIFGLVSDVEEEFVNLTDWERFQASADGFSGTASTYYYNDGTQEQILNQTNNSVFLDAIKNKGAFSISGIFNCPASVGEQIDDYGIKVELVDKKGLVDSYYLNTHYFSGQPFNTLESFQKRIIKLDKVVDLSEVKVSLWSDPGYTSISDDSNVFWVKDLQISAGALMELSNTLSAKIEAENGKNYFYKTNPKADVVDSITLTATAYADKQVLSASSIQYYWLIKDDNIKEDDKQYLPFVGKGWRCINKYHEVEAIGITGKIQVWDNKKNSINFDKGNDNYEEYFSNYLTQLKCAIKYQNVVAISDEFEILNYNKESFYATVESNVEPKLLILSTDKVELTCQVDDRNDLTDKNDYDFKYQWQKKVDGGVYQSLEKNTTAILTVKDDGKNATEGQYEMAKGEEVASFRCVVEVYKKGSEDLVTTIYSESIEVTSKVAVAAELSQPTYYKYYISSSDSVLFEKKEESDKWNGDWVIFDPSQTDSSKLVWTFISKYIDNDAFNYLKNCDELGNDSYLYYTSQTKWIEKKENKENLLKEENWTLPRLLRGKIGNIELPSETIDKMNTFNDLTGGGKKQGIYLEDVVYERTEDTAYQKGKTYYYISGKVDGKPNYIKFEGETFVPDTIYYEKADEGQKKLYVNAEYIKTGTLLVGDDIGTAKFYADIDTGAVKVAGFTVDENSISSNLNESNEIYLGTEGLRIGDTLDIKIDSTTKKASGSFKGSFTFSSGEDVEDTINNIQIGGRNLIFNSKGNSLDGWICNIGSYFGQIVTDSEKKSCIEISNTTTSELFIATPRTAALENYENYTFSCDIWVGNYTQSVDFYFMSDTEDDQKTQAGYVNFNCFKSGYIPTVREKWHRFTQTFKMVDNAYTGYIRIDNNGTTTTGNTAIVKIANIKLERGNKATDWSPAPEDMATNTQLTNVTTLVNGIKDDLQAQIDGEITTWFEAGKPTLENIPAKDWTTSEEKERHIGDLYYDTDTQYCYRWSKTGEVYSWNQIADEGITEALAAAAAAQGTADKKRQIFYISSFSVTNLPDDYDVNDMLVVGTLATNAGDATGTPDTQFYICITKKGDNAKSLQHWKKATDMATISTLNQKYQEALEKSQEYTDGKETIINASISAAVEELNQTISDGAYFTVNQDIYEGQHPEGLKVPAIVVATENEKGADFLYLQSSNLIVNSDVLKINHNGITYTPNYFEVNVENAIFKGTIGAENLEVDKLSTITANMGELTVGAIKSENYDAIPNYLEKENFSESFTLAAANPIKTTYSVNVNGNTIFNSYYYDTLFFTYRLNNPNLKVNNIFISNLSYDAITDTGLKPWDSSEIKVSYTQEGAVLNIRVFYVSRSTLGEFPTTSALNKIKPEIVYFTLTFSTQELINYTVNTGAIISFESSDFPYIAFPKFQVTSQGDIYSTGGMIGGFTIGNNALYNGYSTIDSPSFNTIESNTVYLGTDGIRLGEKFSVSPLGRLIAEEGNIAGFEISQTALINTDGTSYIEISQKGTNNNYSVSLKGDELVFSHTELDGAITSMHYSRYKENSLLITGEKDANSRRANTILDTMISYSPSLGAGSRITEAATFLTGLKDTYDYRIGYSTAPPIIIGKQQEYNSSGVYRSLIKMGSFLSFPDYKTGVLNYNHAYAYTEKDDDKSTWLLYDYKDNKTYDLPELIKFTAENKEYAESHKFYIWEYPREITGDMVVASNNKDYPANHRFSKIFGAIATGRRTRDDMNSFKWNAILSTRIDDTIVRVASDSGKCEGGFYCIIFGK